jgi:ATPase family associated with various cellular activities (AAA)
MRTILSRLSDLIWGKRQIEVIVAGSDNEAPTHVFVSTSAEEDEVPAEDTHHGHRQDEPPIAHHHLHGEGHLPGESSEDPDEAGDPDEPDDPDDGGADEGSAVTSPHPRSFPPELQYLDSLIRHRIRRALHLETEQEEPQMPPYSQCQLPAGEFIIHYNLANPSLSDDEARVLLIALAHHVQSDLFDHSINSVLKGDNDFPRIGGIRGKNFRGFIPTGETAVFLLAGDDWKKSLAIQGLFWADHLFAREKILWLSDVDSGEPGFSGKIILSQDYVDVLAHNKVIAPHHSINFPARLIATNRNRSHLVINNQLEKDYEHLLNWIEHKDEVEKKWQDGKKGYRCLFHGPSGTGKTFAASILGKEAGKEVYKIDLSMVVSKYIGETEKNLELIFARAESKGWILFFDEADALFGKRTNVRDAHDKYANQEVSYLLQRIEDYDGLVILATNMRNNIDDAFLRRFDSDLRFSMPNKIERRSIWQKSLPAEAEFNMDEPRKKLEQKRSEKVNENIFSEKRGERIFYRYNSQGKKPAAKQEVRQDAEKSIPSAMLEIIKQYPLSGASIQNVVHYATIRATTQQAAKKQKDQPAPGTEAEDVKKQVDPKLVIYHSDLIDGIRREMTKNGIPIGYHLNKNNSTIWDNRRRD